MPEPKDNRVAVRGLDIAGKVVFELRWNNNKLVLTGVPPCKEVRLLVLLDAGKQTEKALFVLPVLAKTFELDDKKNGRFKLQGDIRNFLPPTGSHSHGSTSFEMDVVASSAATTLLRFNELMIGGVSAKNLECNLATLENITLKLEHSLVVWTPPYANDLALDLQPALGGDPSQHTWKETNSFVTPDVPEEKTDHATLVLVRSAEFPVASGDQIFPCFDLACKGSEFPVRGAGSPLPNVYYMTFSQRLPWDWTFARQNRGTGSWLVRTDFPQSPLLKHWTEEVVNPITAAVRLIEAGRPLTTLPSLETETIPDPNNPPTWNAWFTFFDRHEGKKLKKENFRAGSVAQVSGAEPDNFVTIVPRRVTPRNDKPRASAVFSAMKKLNGDSLVGSFTCLPRNFSSEQDYHLDGGQGLAFRLRQEKPPDQHDVPTSQQIRMGAFDLHFLPREKKTGDVQPLALEWSDASNEYEAWWETEAGDSFKTTKPWFRRGKVAVGISSIAPGGEDDVPGEEYAEDLHVDTEAKSDVERLGRRKRPLVFALDTVEANPWLPRYRLEMAEVIEPRETQTVDFALHEVRNNPDSKLARAVIIDPQPWMITLVEAPPLKALDPETTNEIANWTNRANLGAGWQVQAQPLGFDLVMPPQAIGEAMHRRREDADIVPGTPIDFRFTPPARLRLQPMKELRRFTEPAWNLRRITEAPLGAGLLEAVFELLYGVEGHFQSSTLRLSEITARLGQYPGVPSKHLPWPADKPQKEIYEKTREMWLGILGGILSRLAVLESWSPLRPSFVITQENGLQYQLRESASLYYPVRGQDESGPPASLPKYFKPDGLKGGWSWGFESRNVLNAVTREPKSFAGTLTGFYLSSFGGWGQQRAVFDRGLSTIISRVDMGRASTIVIERIGRISVFWNRAKHVIVYERTVAASRQFYQEQYPLVGNPVLRKVDEYVEILEPERDFPERDAPASSRAFVTGCRFADGEPPRIRVNSRWGRDIGTTGWKIPLWIRGAQPADVYPKPTIFILGANARGERVPVALDDPDKLYFYTSTDQRLGVDTNAWPAVEGVDFSAVDPLWLKPPSSNATTDPVNYRAEDLPIKQGLGAFTLRLQPSPAAVNHVAGRTTEKAISAIPENITVMRAGIIEAISATPGQTAVRELRSDIENSFAAFVGADPIKNFAAAMQEFDDAFVKATASSLVALDVIKLGTNVCGDLQRRVSTQFQQFAGEAKLEAASALHLFEQQFRTIAKQAFPVANLEQLKEKLRDALAHVAGNTGGARAQLRNLRGLPGEALAKLDQILEDLRKLNARVDEAFAKAIVRIGNLPDWPTPIPPATLAAVLDEINKLKAEAEEFIKRSGIDYRIAEIARTWLGTLPDKARIELDISRQIVNGKIDELVDELVPKKKTRDDVIQALRETAGDAYKAIVDLIVALDENWRAIFDPDTEEPWPIESVLGSIEAQLLEVINKLDTIDPAKVFQAFDVAAAQFYDKLDAQLEALITQTGASEAAGALAKSICDKILASAANLENYLKTVLNGQKLRDLGKLLPPAISPAEFLRRVDQILTEMLDTAGGLTTLAGVHLPKLNVDPRLASDDLLRLFRSFGRVPELPQLNFTLPRLGYYFVEPDLLSKLPKLLPHIDLSPVAAAANKLANNVLNSVNLSVPVKQLLERFVPADMTRFDLSKALPRLAGLDLTHLFRAIRLPSMANEGVRVTHGIDEVTRSGWLQSEVDVTYQETLPVFDIAGVRLMLSRARITATIRVETVLGQQPRQKTFGAIRGDWNITAGGFDLVELNDCTLQFDEGGRIRFHVTPAKVQLKPPLNFLSDILKPFGGSENGFKVAITPAGVQTTLNLPVPNMQAGSFGIANLVLGFLFALDVPNFKIRTALSIGKPTRPFTLTVFILGGAGYFNFGMAYLPATGELTFNASIAIFASASLAISLGPISGGIYAYFGIAIDYFTSNKGGSNLAVTLKIIFAGEVNVLGFITVGLTLGLDASYDSQKNLTGRGYVSISIKIGWFIDIKVNAAVSYTFGKGTTTSSSTQIQSAADSYVDMF